MEKPFVADISRELASEFSRFCVPESRAKDEMFLKGVDLKETWVRDKLDWGEPFARVALLEGEIAGIIQFQPVPEEEVFHILCIFVPRKEHWGKGLGSLLLDSLKEEARKPQDWNGGRPASGITAWAFSGEAEGQLSMKDFFLKKGFQPFPDNPDFLFLPLEEGFRLKRRRLSPSYIRQEEDTGKAVILYGPSFCPWDYFFYRLGEQAVRELTPEIPIRWINRVEEPEEFQKRGGFEGIVVNSIPIKTFVLEKEEFSKEVREALGFKR